MDKNTFHRIIPDHGYHCRLDLFFKAERCRIEKRALVQHQDSLKKAGLLNKANAAVAAANLILLKQL
jgi:hypothetical protein